jgi:hypothetical protein
MSKFLKIILREWQFKLNTTGYVRDLRPSHLEYFQGFPVVGTRNFPHYIGPRRPTHSHAHCDRHTCAMLPRKRGPPSGVWRGAVLQSGGVSEAEATPARLYRPARCFFFWMLWWEYGHTLPPARMGWKGGNGGSGTAYCSSLASEAMWCITRSMHRKDRAAICCSHTEHAETDR